MRPAAVLPLVLLAAVLTFADALRAQPAKGKKYAVLVGVNEYTKPRFEALRFAEKDMRDLKAELEAAGFAVTLLLGSATGDAEATAENIRKVLLDKNGVLKTVTQDDTVLVAFSGHGEQIAVKGGEKDKEAEAPFFCPKHAVSGDPDTQVNLNDVLDALDKRGAGTNLVLVDACRKYAARVDGKKSGASMDRAKVQSLRDGIGVMFACADRQTALESPKAGDGHGLFFCAVLDALKEAKQPGKAVTWERLVPEIRAKVVALTDELAKTTPEKERQRPQYIGNFTRDPVLIAAAARVADDHPYKNAKVGDFVTFKMDMKFGLSLPDISGSATSTVIAKTDTEVTVRTSAKIGQQDSKDAEQKIDLTKPFDPTRMGQQATGDDAKVEKLDDGKEKVKAGGREYDTTWVAYKVTTKATPKDVETVLKVWMSKDVPGGVVKMETSIPTGEAELKMFMILEKVGRNNIKGK